MYGIMFNIVSTLVFGVSIGSLFVKSFREYILENFEDTLFGDLMYITFKGPERGDNTPVLIIGILCFIFLLVWGILSTILAVIAGLVWPATFLILIMTGVMYFKKRKNLKSE